MVTQLFLFTEYGVANAYGIGTYLSLVVEALKNSPDFNITIVEIMSNRKKIVCENDSGVRHLYIPFSPAFQDKESYCRSLYYLLRYRYIVSDGNIIFHFNFQVCRNLLILLKTYYPMSRIVYTVHYTLSDISGISSDETNKAERLFMESCDLLIAISEHRYRYLVAQCGFSPNKIRFLPHGIYDEFNQNLKSSLLFNQFELTHEKLILYVGRLDENKRVSLLLEAFKIVLKVVPDVHLVVAGEGLHLPMLLQKCCQMWRHVTFTGFLQHKDLLNLYAHATLGVLPSRYEELSFVALEMIMHGLPVIANDTTGLADILGPSKAGKLLLLNQMDTEDAPFLLAKAIVEMLSDKGLQQTYGAAARKLYEEKYCFDKFQTGLLNVYSNL